MATAYTPTDPRAGQASARTDLLSRWLGRGLVLNGYTLAFIAIFAIAVFTRFYDLGARVMSHDESLHTYYSWLLYRNGDFQHTPLMHGPILFHVTALSYFLFGASDFTARIYPAVLGVFMVLSPLLFTRWLGRTGALIASVLILVSPLLLYHHRYIREDTPAIMATILMVWATFQYIDGPLGVRRKARWLYIFSAAFLWNMASKETAFMYVAIYGLFLTVFWVLRLYQNWRSRGTKSLFYHLTLAASIAGTLALVFYCIFAISLATYDTLEGRTEFLQQQFGAIGSGTLTLEFSQFASWSLLAIAATVAIVFGTAIYAFRRGEGRLRLGEILILLALVLTLTGGLIVFEEVSKLPSRAETLVEDPDNDIVETVARTNAPIIATWIVSAGFIALLVYSRYAGWWKHLYRYAELDILWLMGTLILPWMTGLITSATGASPVDYSQAGIERSLAVLIPLAALSITAGLVWNPKRWLIAAAIFHILFAFFYTTMFTNPMGLATGMIGSLGYWLEQQGVRRGSQPQYYYQLIIMPVYEYLPMIGSFLGMLAGMTLFWSHRRRSSIAAEERAVLLAGNETAAPADAETRRRVQRHDALFGVDALRRVPFSLFCAFWAVYIFLAFTLAGEKMPWLGTHLTLPMILVTAWYFGRVFDNTDWARFRQRGWILLLILPVLFVAAFQAIAPFLVGQSPFGGLQQEQLARLGQWIAVLAVVAGLSFGVYLVVRRTGLLHLRHMIGVAAVAGLSLLTFRHAWMASFINYDYATEYLVYAHGAPGIKLMMEQIDELSRRTVGGNNIRFAWGGNAWPVTWYFRDLTNATFFAGNPSPDALRDAAVVYASEDIRSRVEPLLEDRYYRFEYMRMWWPSWNYYNLTAQRAANTLDFSPENTTAAEIRRGIFDIWWARDYTRYGQATGENYALETWNPGERLYFYVRKDIAAQVWNLGLGDTSVLNPLESSEPNLCVENWQRLPALAGFTDPAAMGAPALNRPMDMAASADGRVYVADEANNRIVVYDRDGNFLSTIDGLNGGTGFQRPNSVAILPDGNLVIADTWNFRVVIYTPEGQFVRGWGQNGQFGAEAQPVPTDALWGPRDVAVDAEGNIYVSDTGNKRVRVYTSTGEYLRDIGSAGAEVGQLEEPSGIAVGPDNRLYVADTWNRRISVFSTDGTPLYTFPVRGWFEDLGNRPYLALDPARNLLYVTDMDAGRVLVFDTQGTCVGSFGQPGDQTGDLSQFSTVGGITVDQAGTVFVSDLRRNQVRSYAPFTVETAGQGGVLESLADQGLVVDGMIDQSAMSTIESMAEGTAESTAAE
jgi:predicted membrane-bound mannosyltransferase/DNA-binding beta-propeller fold protein YncE